jgi:hypothetical protein
VRVRGPNAVPFKRTWYELEFGMGSITNNSKS